MSFKVGPFHCGFAPGSRQVTVNTVLYCTVLYCTVQVTANTCAQCSGRGAGCGGDCVQEAGRCCHPALCNSGGSVRESFHNILRMGLLAYFKKLLLH